MHLGGYPIDRNMESLPYKKATAVKVLVGLLDLTES